MIVDEKLDSDYLAMAELTKEIGLIVSDSFDKGHADLSYKITIAGNYYANSCDDRHEPIYKIKYDHLTLVGNTGQWLVCEKCFRRQEFFGVTEETESIVSLRNCIDIGLEIEPLFMMTGTVPKNSKIIF